jgi:cytochrome c553
MMRWIMWIVIVLPLSAHAAGQDTRQFAGEHLAASCAACHGSDGNPVDTVLPTLAGQDKQALLASLLAYKSGARPSTVMQQISKGYSDEQLTLIAEYFSHRKSSNGAGQ